MQWSPSKTSAVELDSSWSQDQWVNEQLVNESESADDLSSDEYGSDDESSPSDFESDDESSPSDFESDEKLPNGECSLNDGHAVPTSIQSSGDNLIDPTLFLDSEALHVRNEDLSPDHTGSRQTLAAILIQTIILSYYRICCT